MRLRDFREKSDLLDGLGEFVLRDFGFALKDGEGQRNPFETKKVVSTHTSIPCFPVALPICSNLDFENRSLRDTIHKNRVFCRLQSDTYCTGRYILV